MPSDDLGSLGPVRLPFQFGKGADCWREVAAGPLTREQFIRNHEAIPSNPWAEMVGWDSLGTECVDFGHG